METASLRPLPERLHRRITPITMKITETHTIIGGTGRFTGAQGSFPVDRMHAFASESDGTHLTFGSFLGTMTSPGAAR
jgi:hypothetical protein